MQLTSKAFDHQTPLPARFTQDGENISPPLEWKGLPKNCRELALICEDPDAPLDPGQTAPVVHWLIYNIPSEEKFLREAIPVGRVLMDPFHVYQGVNSTSLKAVGYTGPKPPIGHGVHRYIFTLFALDAELHLPPGASCEEVMSSINKHTMEKTELIGTYERSLRRNDETEKKRYENQSHEQASPP